MHIGFNSAIGFSGASDIGKSLLLLVASTYIQSVRTLSLPLSERLVCDPLRLRNLSGVALGAQRVRQLRLGERLEVRPVVLVGLACVSIVGASGCGTRGARTKGRPQYVHQQIWGLSVLMKILGWPRGPPPPSQETMRSWVQRTGCWWMRSIAAYGRGCTRRRQPIVNHPHPAHVPGPP
jgi:hypothetical protein